MTLRSASTEVKPEPDFAFPGFYKSTITDLVILAHYFKEGCLYGMVVDTGKSTNGLGHYSKDWLASHFVRFYGTVTISDTK